MQMNRLRKTSLVSCTRRQSKLFSWKFHRTNEILGKDGNFLFGKKRVGVPTHFVSIRQKKRRRDDDDHLNSRPSRSPCRNYPNERLDRLHTSFKQKKHKMWTEHYVQLPRCWQFSPSKKHRGREMQHPPRVKTWKQFRKRHEGAKEKMRYSIMNDSILFFIFTCRRLDRVTGVRFIDAHQAGLGTRWEVESHRTVQRETQIYFINIPRKTKKKKKKMNMNHTTFFVVVV